MWEVFNPLLAMHAMSTAYVQPYPVEITTFVGKYFQEYF